MHNLIEYHDNDNNDNMTDFNGANNTGFFDLKEKVTGQTNADGTIKAEIAVPLKYLSDF